MDHARAASHFSMSPGRVSPFARSIEACEAPIGPYGHFNKVKSGDMTRRTCDANDPLPKSELGLPKFDGTENPKAHHFPAKKLKILLTNANLDTVGNTEDLCRL